MFDLQEVFEHDAVEVLADLDGVFVEHVTCLRVVGDFVEAEDTLVSRAHL